MPVNPKQLIENTRQILNDCKIQSLDEIQKLIDMKKRYPNATTNINEILIQIDPKQFVFKPFWEIEYLNLVKYASDRRKTINFTTDQSNNSASTNVCYLDGRNFIQIIDQEWKQETKMICKIRIGSCSNEMVDLYVTRKYNILKHVISESIKQYMERKKLNSKLSQNDKKIIIDQIHNNHDQMALLTEYNGIIIKINETDISILARYYTYDSFEIEISILRCDKCQCHNYNCVICDKSKRLAKKIRETDTCLSCNQKGKCHENPYMNLEIPNRCSMCKIICMPEIAE